MKRCICFVLFLLLLLTACATSTTESTPTPGPSAAATSAEPTATPDWEPANTEEPYQWVFDTLNNYNRIFSKDGFVASLDSEPGLDATYRFDNEAHGISVRVCPLARTEKDYAEAIVTYGEKTLTIPVEFPLVSNIAEGGYFSLADLTGDGLPELYLLLWSGGTGVHISFLHVVDLDAMEELTVEPFIPALKEGFSGSFLGFREEESGEKAAIYELSAEGSPTVTALMRALRKEEPEGWAPFVGDGWTSIEVTDGVISAKAGITISNATPGYGMAYISGEYAYEPETRSFHIVPPYSIEVFEPM